MKGMKSASEDFIVPPPGRYESEIVGTECKNSKAGSAMIHLTVEIKSPEEYSGVQAHDYILTDGTSKGAGMGKKKLRGLGINVDATDDEIPDEQIAAHLLGQRLWVQYGNEQGNEKDAKGNYTIPMWRTDPKTGVSLPLMKLNVKEYFQHNVGGAGQAAGLVQQAALPVQQFAQPVQQFAQPVQQQFNPAAPLYGQVPPGQGYAQPVQQQFAPQAQQFAPQAAPVQQFAPQGAVALQQGQQLPPGFAAQPTNGSAPLVQGAVPPWVAAQAQVQQGEVAEGGKRGKKK